MKKWLCFIMVVSLALMATLPVLADPNGSDTPDPKMLIQSYTHP